MATDSGAALASTRPTTSEDEQQLVAYCARPLCREEFRRVPGPGRPAAFCSDLCRRRAEKEFRQTTSRLANYEAVVEQLRIDVAAFSHSIEIDVGEDGSVTPEMRRRAEDAVQHAAGAVAFLRDASDPAERELRALYDAVAPVIRTSSS